MECPVTKNIVFLSKSLTNVEEVLLNLIEVPVISIDEKDQIQLPGNTPLKSNNLLWDILVKKEWDRVKFAVIRILRNTSNEHCADVLEGKETKESVNIKTEKPLTGKWWPSPLRCCNSFYERKIEDISLVEQLHEILNNDRKETVPQKLAIVGLGGVGKTSTAKWFANYYCDIYDHVIWIDCERDDLQKSFENLGQSLKVENWERVPLKYLALKCYEKLSRTKCLIIFDNAECYNGPYGLSNLMPSKLESNFHCIITSRNVNWGHSNGLGEIPTYALNCFTKTEGATFLSNSLDPDLVKSSRILEHLSSCLGNLPLALQIAVAVINKEKLDVEKYVNRILSTNSILHTSFDDYERTINDTMSISLNHMQNNTSSELAYQFLIVFGYLSCDNIPVAFFQAIHEVNEHQTDLAVELLKEYSLLTVAIKRIRGADCKILNIHRLLQQVIRKRTEHEAEGILRQILKSQGYLNHKTVPFYYAERYSNLTKEFLMLKSYLGRTVSLRKLLDEKLYNEAVELSLHISIDDNMDCKAQTIAEYNYAFCLNKAGHQDKSLQVFEKLFRKMALWNLSVHETNNLDRVDQFEEIPIHYKEFIGIQCVKLQMQLGLLSQAVKYFSESSKIFQRYFAADPFYLLSHKNISGCLFEQLITVGCTLAKKYAKPLDLHHIHYVISVTVSLLKGPLTTFNIWKNFRNEIESLFGLSNDTDLLLYTSLYNSLMNIKWGEVDENEFKAFVRQLSKIIGNVKALDFGKPDDLCNAIKNLEIAVKTNGKDGSDEIEIKSNNSILPLEDFTQFRNKNISRNVLRKLIISNYRVLRSELIDFLSPCINLESLILENIDLVGNASGVLYLPNIQVFGIRLVNYQFVPKPLHYYKFFTKSGSLTYSDEWCEITKMSLFSIYEQHCCILHINRPSNIFSCSKQYYIFNKLLENFSNVRLSECYLSVKNMGHVTSLTLNDVHFVKDLLHPSEFTYINHYFGANLKYINLTGNSFMVDLTPLKSVVRLSLQGCRVFFPESTIELNCKIIALQNLNFWQSETLMKDVNINEILGNFENTKSIKLSGCNLSVDLTLAHPDFIALYGVTLLNCDKIILVEDTIEQIILVDVHYKTSDHVTTNEPSFLYSRKVIDVDIKCISHNHLPSLNLDLTKLHKVIKRLRLNNVCLNDLQLDANLCLPNLEQLTIVTPQPLRLLDLYSCSKLETLKISAEHSICQASCRKGICSRPKSILHFDRLPETMKNLYLSKVECHTSKKRLNLDTLALKYYSSKDILNILDYVSSAANLTVYTAFDSRFATTYAYNSGKYNNDSVHIMAVMQNKSSKMTLGEFEWSTYDEDEIHDYGLSQFGVNEKHSCYVIENGTKNWTGVYINADQFR